MLPPRPKRDAPYRRCRHFPPFYPAGALASAAAAWPERGRRANSAFLRARVTRHSPAVLEVEHVTLGVPELATNKVGSPSHSATWRQASA